MNEGNASIMGDSKDSKIDSKQDVGTFIVNLKSFAIHHVDANVCSALGYTEDQLMSKRFSFRNLVPRSSRGFWRAGVCKSSEQLTIVARFLTRSLHVRWGVGVVQQRSSDVVSISIVWDLPQYEVEYYSNHHSCFADQSVEEASIQRIAQQRALCA